MINKLEITYNHKFDLFARLAIFIVQVILIVFFIFTLLQRTALGPTLDDSWIHYQFARNLALYGEISFNKGVWSTGTTSLLWDLILAVGILMGIPVVEFSIALGILLYFILGQQVYSLFRTYWGNHRDHLLSVLIVVLTGNIIWYSLSGMETILFLVLGLWWIVTFERRKYIIAGLLSGALMLTRIEGFLFLIIGIFFAFRNLGFKKGVKNALYLILFSLPFILPSIILNLIVAGEFYPTTMAGKKWLYNLKPGFWNLSLFGIAKYIGVWATTFFQTNWWPELIDRPTTIQYPLWRLLTGGRVDKTVMDFAFKPYPMWFQLFTVIIGVILLFILFRGMLKVIIPVVKNIFRKKELKSWEYLVWWFLAQNLIYIVLMPIRGHGGRYQALNFILAGLFLIAGVEIETHIRNFASKILNFILKPGILLIYLIGIFSWNDIYADSTLHVNKVHRAAGEWLKSNLPTGTPIAVFDVGAVKYFSDLPVTDIAGLTDREALKYVLKGDIVPYMKAKNAQYLVMIEELPAKAAGKELGETFLNSGFYDKLGIRQQIGKSINLIPVKRFEIPMEVWWRHWVALRTHSPVVAIYKIDYLN